MFNININTTLYWYWILIKALPRAKWTEPPIGWGRTHTKITLCTLALLNGRRKVSSYARSARLDSTFTPSWRSQSAEIMMLWGSRRKQTRLRSCYRLECDLQWLGGLHRTAGRMVGIYRIALPINILLMNEYMTSSPVLTRESVPLRKVLISAFPLLCKKRSDISLSSVIVFVVVGMVIPRWMIVFEGRCQIEQVGALNEIRVLVRRSFKVLEKL